MSDAAVIDAGRLLSAILSNEEANVTLAADPRRLEGGKSADLFRFRLSAGPAELAGRDLVLRLPSAHGSTDECSIQRAVAEPGYPAPEVLRSGRLESARPFMIMTTSMAGHSSRLTPDCGHSGRYRDSWPRSCWSFIVSIPLQFEGH